MLKVGRYSGLTDIEASQLGVGAFGLVVMCCHCWERATCFVDFGHCGTKNLELVWFEGLNESNLD